ncbi:uncharacterized protein LOC128551742 [Mercenaria mercenaria]|uniref:uncharacterized protein LOC128551742 n=1 Tax=Mercenaria mercenaria TaxID=6596 RepID=UPI00234F51C3|nr:uncharacterized protein LOC128551742 [Mercenaria mercenaria]
MILQKLLTQRNAQRNVVEQYLEKIEAIKDEANFSPIKYNAVLESLEVKFQQLKVLDEKISNQTDIEELNDETLQTEMYSLDLYMQLQLLKDFGKQREEQTTITQSTSTEQGQNTNAVMTDSQTVSELSRVSHPSQFHKLPNLALPTFDGSILRWQTFWDSFDSTVHSNPNLTDVQRFSYLKNQLEGEAERTIEGFALTNDNYSRAVSLLKERFGQVHKITHATMQALLSLPAPGNALPSLRNFHDKLEAYIRSLESLGECQESYGNLLVPIVIDKLPSEIRRNMTRNHGNNRWQLCELREAIRTELDIIEAGDSISTGQHGLYRYSTTASFLTETHVKTHKPGRCRKCNKRHHTSICNNGVIRNQPQTRPEISSTLRPEAAVFHSTSRNVNAGVLLKTATATVSSGSINAAANILLDEGAQRSFITEDLANQLKLTRQRPETISLSTFGNHDNRLMHLDTATVHIVTDERELIPIHVLIVPSIATPMSNRTIHQVSKYSYLRDLKLAHHITGETIFNISILIGADYYWTIVEDQIIRGEGPTAVKSKLGYLLSGPVADDRHRNVNQSEHVMNVSITSRAADEMSLERFWKLESMGILPEDEDTKDTSVLQQYKATCIDIEDGQYIAKLPWKQEHPTLPTNYNVTLRRTENTIRRLSKEPKMLQFYSKIISDQENRGFIEKVSDVTETQTRVHYIPHHPVRKESSTTPVRIVYDCSCKQTKDHASLNDCLESTPPDLNDITSILLRFRLHRHAVTADIEKAFLQIGLHKDDRDVTRFFWLSNPNDPNSPLVTYRFKSVLFGARARLSY